MKVSFLNLLNHNSRDLDNVGRVDEFTGYTPLHQSQDKNNPDIDNLSIIYLGSEVSVATITHEFFHQLDRHWGREELTDYRIEGNFFTLLINNGLPNTDATLTGRAHNAEREGSLASSYVELWADMGMTAVLHGQDIRLAEVNVYASEDENELVAWDYDASIYKYGEKTEDLFAEYMIRKLSMTGGN